jgi:hypothetical protein
MTSSPSLIHDTVIGLDVGHSAVKVVVDSPALPSRYSLLFPSVVTGALEFIDPTARALAAAETVKHGASAVMEEIVHAIHAQTGRMLSLVEAMVPVEKGHVVDYGARVDIAPFLSAAQAVLVDDVVDTAARLLDRDARGLNGIVVAGGSASLIGDAPRARFRHALIDPNSRLAVAEGFCRLGCALRAGERRRVDRSRQAQTSAHAAAATEA